MVSRKSAKVWLSVMMTRLRYWRIEILRNLHHRGGGIISKARYGLFITTGWPNLIHVNQLPRLKLKLISHSSVFCQPFKIPKWFYFQIDKIRHLTWGILVVNPFPYIQSLKIFWLFRLCTLFLRWPDQVTSPSSRVVVT